MERKKRKQQPQDQRASSKPSRPGLPELQLGLLCTVLSHRIHLRVPPWEFGRASSLPENCKSFSLSRFAPAKISILRMR